MKRSTKLHVLDKIGSLAFIWSDHSNLLRFHSSAKESGGNLLYIGSFSPVEETTFGYRLLIDIWEAFSKMKLSDIRIHHIFAFARDWSQRATSLNIPQQKLGNIRVILRVIYQFLKPCVLQKLFLKDNKHSSLHLARKYMCIKLNWLWV